MRKLLLSLMFSGIGICAFGQFSLKHELLAVPRNDIQALKVAKRSTPFEGWYNNLTEAQTTGFVSYTPYNNTLFSDSMVKVQYGDGNGGTLLDYVFTQSIGEVFDPKKEIYNQPLSIYNSVEIDSIGLPYLYNYVYDSTAQPDKLVFQFYTLNSGGITKSTLQGSGQICAFTKYDYTKNLGKSAIGTYTYTLTEADSQSKINKLISIPVNGLTGLKLKPNDLFAFTVSYVPGFKYNLGDTIDERVSPLPKSLHSHFRYLVGDNTSKETATTTYEMSLNVTTGTRYNQTTYRGQPNGWNGNYVPGTAWLSYDQIVWSLFYVKTTNVGVETSGEIKGYSLGTVYPNPNHGHANIDFSIAKPENVTIKIFDVVGHEVATLTNNIYGQGTHTINFDTQNFKSGLYFYSITAGNYSKTMKFTVTE